MICPTHLPFGHGEGVHWALSVFDFEAAELELWNSMNDLGDPKEVEAVRTIVLSYENRIRITSNLQAMRKYVDGRSKTEKIKPAQQLPWKFVQKEVGVLLHHE